MSAQNFVDPYQDPFAGIDFSKSFYSKGATDDTYGKTWLGEPSFFGAKISDFLGATNYKGMYDATINKLNREYERQAVNSARAWDEYMDTTKYQRAVKDIEAAGLNPWLLVQSGGIGAGSTGTTASTGSSARSKTYEKGSSKLNAFAMLLLAGAKILSLL